VNKFRNKKVLITGAASGIGYTTAENFAGSGAELILTDINAEGLEQAAGKLRALGATVHTRCVDVSDKAGVFAMADWVINEIGGLDILINNAGIGYSGELAETSLETWERLIKINVWGVLYHVYAFLPHMIKRRSGQIVNISSGQAFFRLPTWGAYACTKLLTGAFSEILHFELKKYGISVTTVYPFMINTPFYKNVEADTFGARLSMKLLPYYSMSPETVGRIIFKAAAKRRNVEMVTVLNDVGFYSRFFSPVSSIMSTATNMLLAKSAAEYRNPAESQN